MSWLDDLQTNDWFQAAKTVVDGVNAQNDKTKIQAAPTQQAAVLNNIPMDQNANNVTGDAKAFGQAVQQQSKTVSGLSINPIYIGAGVAAFALLALMMRG